MIKDEGRHWEGKRQHARRAQAGEPEKEGGGSWKKRAQKTSGATKKSYSSSGEARWYNQKREGRAKILPSGQQRVRLRSEPGKEIEKGGSKLR